MSTARPQDYITVVRQANQQVWDGINALVELKREWNALDYGTNLPDGAGANSGILKTDVGAVVFASADALVAVLDGGIAGNMAKLL